MGIGLWLELEVWRGLYGGNYGLDVLGGELVGYV